MVRQLSLILPFHFAAFALFAFVSSQPPMPQRDAPFKEFNDDELDGDRGQIIGASEGIQRLDIGTDAEELFGERKRRRKRQILYSPNQPNNFGYPPNNQPNFGQYSNYPQGMFPQFAQQNPIDPNSYYQQQQYAANFPQQFDQNQQQQQWMMMARLQQQQQQPFQPQAMMAQQPFQPQMMAQQPFQPQMMAQQPFQPQAMMAQQPFQQAMMAQQPFQQAMMPQQPFQPQAMMAQQPFQGPIVF